MSEVAKILADNEQRNEQRNTPFNPITGQGSVGERFSLTLTDFALTDQYLPMPMKDIPFVSELAQAGSFGEWIEQNTGSIPSEDDIERCKNAFIRLRCRHDFPFWAAMFVKILSKEPGEGEILFRLTRPQRAFVERLESKRVAGLPIRFVLLKARQWGGSTTSQLYMAWLQLVHKVGLNSVIVSQTKKTSFTIKAMFDRALNSYPTALLHKLGEEYADDEKKMENVGLSGDYKRVPSRDCTITIASYESPDALRGDAYALVHCSEVGLWSPTDKKSPDSVIRSACSGVAYKPYTMIIFESTANGTGNFFHREYLAAKAGKSQFDALFVSWFDIDMYAVPFRNDQEKEDFARSLWENRNNEVAASEREECGQYLWWLWEQGATLEAINWYIIERRGKNDHAVMASEYPSDDVEAFVHSGSRVFDQYQIEALRPSCQAPKFIGELQGEGLAGADALRDVHFVEDSQGMLAVWEEPEEDGEGEKILNRYLCVMDIGGRGARADYTVMTVFDRVWMTDGMGPIVVAQWRGHGDHDRTAWKAAQIAKWYNNALLVIESNTLETKDRDRDVDGDQSHFILNQIRDHYDNLYARRQSEEDIRIGAPRKYGFHTNTATKPMIIDTLVMAVRDQLYTERVSACLDEMVVYEKRQNGSYGAIAGYHDDMLMTRAIGLHICFNEMDPPKIVKIDANPTPHLRPKRTVSEAQIF